MLTLKPRRLPARYAGLLMPFILSILMSGIVSFIATLKAAGLHEGLVALWLGAWQISWLIAFPTLLVVLPLVRRIVSVLVEPAPPAELSVRVELPPAGADPKGGGAVSRPAR